MSLLTRLIDPQEGEDKLPVHQFMAALAEIKRGAPQATVQNLTMVFDLSAGEVASLIEFNAKMADNSITRELIHDVLMLGEAGIYPLAVVKSRLQIT